MEKVYKILSIFAIPSILLLYSYSGGSLGGKSGSPGDNGSNCTACHSGTAVNQAGLISTNIPFQGYEAGQTYTITVSANMAGITKYGFELTAEDENGVKQGTFIITNTAKTKLTNGNKAVTHTSGGTGANGNAIAWSVDWQAPAQGTGKITFYVSVNATNSNGSTSGDQVNLSSRSVSEYIANPEITGVIPDMVAQDFSGEVIISGSQTNWSQGVETVRFVLHDDSTVSFTPVSFTVNSDVEITAMLDGLANQAVGVYDVQVDNLILENGFTLTIADIIAGQHQLHDITIYPNPATNYFRLENIENAQVRIYTSDGKNIMQINGLQNQEKVDISKLTPGIYYLHLTDNHRQTVKKLLITK